MSARRYPLLATSQVPDLEWLVRELYARGYTRENRALDDGLHDLIRCRPCWPYIYVTSDRAIWFGADYCIKENSLTLVNSPRQMIDYLKRMEGHHV